jgi:hypothetical protein
LLVEAKRLNLRQNQRQSAASGMTARLDSTQGSSSSCAVVAKTDNAQSVVNILSAIHLKKDTVNNPRAPSKPC